MVDVTNDRSGCGFCRSLAAREGQVADPGSTGAPYQRGFLRLGNCNYSADIGHLEKSSIGADRCPSEPVLCAVLVGLLERLHPRGARCLGDGSITVVAVSSNTCCLSQLPRQIFCLQMRIPSQHAQVLMAGDAGDLHDIQTLLE